MYHQFNITREISHVQSRIAEELFDAVRCGGLPPVRDVDATRYAEEVAVLDINRALLGLRTRLVGD